MGNGELVESESCELAICRRHLRQARRRLPRRRKRLLAMTARGLRLGKREADSFVPASFCVAGGEFVMFRGFLEAVA